MQYHYVFSFWMKCFKLITIKLTFWLHGSWAEEVEDRLKCVQVLGERWVAELCFRFWPNHFCSPPPPRPNWPQSLNCKQPSSQSALAIPGAINFALIAAIRAPIVITAVLAIISQIIALAISLAARFIAIAIAVDQRGSRSRESKPHQISESGLHQNLLVCTNDWKSTAVFSLAFQLTHWQLKTPSNGCRLWLTAKHKMAPSWLLKPRFSEDLPRIYHKKLHLWNSQSLLQPNYDSLAQ